MSEDGARICTQPIKCENMVTHYCFIDIDLLIVCFITIAYNVCPLLLWQAPAWLLSTFSGKITFASFICFIIIFSICDSPRETNPPHACRSRNDTRMSPDANPLRAKSNVLLTIRNLRTARALHWNRNEPKGAAHQNLDEPYYPPLRGAGHKKSYLPKLSSLHLQPACPTSWWEKPAYATRKNQKSKQSSTNLPYLPTRYQAWTGTGRAGKSSQSQNAELSDGMQMTEPRMDYNQRGKITSEKFLLAAWAVRNFSPLLSRPKNTLFIYFTLSQRKLLLSVQSCTQVWPFLCICFLDNFFSSYLLNS